MISEFNIVTRKDNDIYVLLYVNESDLLNVDVANKGLYAFKGMWYGDDPTDYKSYGKVTKLKERDIKKVLFDDIRELDINHIKNML